MFLAPGIRPPWRRIGSVNVTVKILSLCCLRSDWWAVDHSNGYSIGVIWKIPILFLTRIKESSNAVPIWWTFSRHPFIQSSQIPSEISATEQTSKFYNIFNVTTHYISSFSSKFIEIESISPLTGDRCPSNGIHSLSSIFKGDYVKVLISYVLIRHCMCIAVCNKKQLKRN